jgi:hypothetical protein
VVSGALKLRHLLLLPAILAATELGAQDAGGHQVPPPAIGAVRLSTTITIDGRLDESAWAEGRPGTDFRQREPNGGEPATQRTEVSLRGNAVARWEYRPGSTLFFVWTQDRNDATLTGDLNFSSDRHELFTAKPNNIFLIKTNYWVGR